MAAAPVLEAHALTRRFTGVLALSGVDFRLFAGEIHALMGQNGAGKSTLIKILTGVYPADEGELRLGGAPIHPGSPAAAQRLGISTVYQEVNLCPNLSVAENIFAGRYPRRGATGLWRIDWPRMHAGARELRDCMSTSTSRGCSRAIRSRCSRWSRSRARSACERAC